MWQIRRYWRIKTLKFHTDSGNPCQEVVGIIRRGKKLISLMKKHTVQILAVLAWAPLGSVWSSVKSHCCGAAVEPYALGCRSVAWEGERQETGALLNRCLNQVSSSAQTAEPSEDDFFTVHVALKPKCWVILQQCSPKPFEHVHNSGKELKQHWSIVYAYTCVRHCGAGLQLIDAAVLPNTTERTS